MELMLPKTLTSIHINIVRLAVEEILHPLRRLKDLAKMFNRSSNSNLKTLRENARLSQVEVSNLTGVSTTRISLSENNLLMLTPIEEEAIRSAILDASNEGHVAVLRQANPRFERAMDVIERDPDCKKAFDTLRESLGYSEMEAAVFVLGHNYPKDTFGSR
jgi:transcriptional regulator with XRE-family HTH domain